MGRMKTKAGLVIYDRAEWGARAPRAVDPIGTIRRAAIHHGGPVGAPRRTKRAAITTCRVWQDFHMDAPDHGWNDIGYHFLVDARGRLYQGRRSDHLGAHVLNQNTGNIGFNFMQDGRRFHLTRRQKRTLRTLFEHGIPEHHVPPLKQLARDARLDHYVRVHRRFPGQATDCPGNLIEHDFDVILKEFRV
jgi:hypothetical protein